MTNPEMDRSKALSSSSDDRNGVAGALELRNCDASASNTASSSVDSLESSWKAEGGGVHASCWLGRVSSNSPARRRRSLCKRCFLLLGLVRRVGRPVSAAQSAGVQ